jgi:hypothetical protein
VNVLRGMVIRTQSFGENHMPPEQPVIYEKNIKLPNCAVLNYEFYRWFQKENRWTIIHGSNVIIYSSSL